MPKAAEGHSFDRRSGDVNVAALAFRVGTLESRVEVVEEKLETNNRELAANTALTKQVHGKVETIETDTATIVEATKWLSSTKKLLLVVFAGVTGACGSIIAAVHALKALGAL